MIVLGFDGWPVTLSVLLAGFGQGIAYPRLFNSALGDVAPHQAGVAAGVLPRHCRSVPPSASPLSAACSSPCSATTLAVTPTARLRHCAGGNQTALLIAMLLSIRAALPHDHGSSCSARIPGIRRIKRLRFCRSTMLVHHVAS